MKKVVIILFCAFFYQVIPIKSNQEMTLSFDTLFPEMPFKIMLDTCMQVWGEIRYLNEISKQEEYHQEIQDLIVGRLVRLNRYIDYIIHEIGNGGVLITRSDIDYMLNIIEQISSEGAVVCEKTRSGSISCAITDLVACARDKILALL